MLTDNVVPGALSCNLKGSNQECKYNLMCLGYTSRNIPKELDEEDYDDEEDYKKAADSSSKKRRLHVIED